VLPQKLTLHELTDVEAVCANVLRRSQVPAADCEEALAFLLVASWGLSERYDAGGRPSRFGHYLKARLPFRLVDWQRQRCGRNTWKFKDGVYERPRVDLVSYDNERDRLDELVAERAGDPETARRSDLDGLLADSGRQRDRDLRFSPDKGPGPDAAWSRPSDVRA
jgi:hypothetical protein